MNSLIKNRWLWVSVCWAAVLGTTFWNSQRAEAIHAARAQNQGLQADLLFQSQYAERLERIRREYAQLFIEVESLQLGVLAAKSKVSEISSALGLRVIQVSAAPIQKGAESATVNATLNGSFENTVLFLLRLESYRHLQVQQLTLRTDPTTHETTCEMAVSVRCRLAPGGGDETPPPVQSRSTL